MLDRWLHCQGHNVLGNSPPSKRGPFSKVVGLQRRSHGQVSSLKICVSTISYELASFSNNFQTKVTVGHEEGTLLGTADFHEDIEEEETKAGIYLPDIISS